MHIRKSSGDIENTYRTLITNSTLSTGHNAHRTEKAYGRNIIHELLLSCVNEGVSRKL